MTNRSICFDERQKETLIAALSFWKRLGGDMMSGNEFHMAGDNRLSDEEIDELIADIRAVESEAEEDGEPDSPSEAPRWLPIGEVCHGSASITDKFKATLEFAQRHRNIIPELDKAVTSLTQFWTQDWDETSAESPLALIDLMDALQTVCPPFCYFGANEGDSSALGVWPSDDEIEQALLDKKMVKIDNWLDVHNVSPAYDWVLVVGFKSGAYERLCGLEDGIIRQVWKI
jgi:hypothetical protein